MHHANQYIITNGYASRSGLNESADGYLKILKLHQAHEVPFHLHVSGTLLECLVWYRPDVLSILRELLDQGLVELIGSSYGQNIMRFFSHEHNLRQLNEQLALYRDLLNVEPRTIQVFWPPERVWDTRRLAPVLTNSALLNGGYAYVLVDDRTLYRRDDGNSSRRMFDQRDGSGMRDYTACRIHNGNELIALPISRTLRWNIPPRDETSLERMEQLLDEFDEATESAEATIAIYADDMEKTAGIGGWDPRGPAHFEVFLQWMCRNRSFRPVKLREWAARQRVVKERPIDVGTYCGTKRSIRCGRRLRELVLRPTMGHLSIVLRQLGNESETASRRWSRCWIDRTGLETAFGIVLGNCLAYSVLRRARRPVESR